jgi:predicted nucleotidyltransferase
MSFKESTLWIKEIFTLIDSVCREMGIQVYLIGAQAKDYYLDEFGKIPLVKTMDFDFAIMMPDIETYDRIIEKLTEKGFKKIKEPYRIIHNLTSSVVDLIPFGEIETNGIVKFSDRMTELSVVGFNEVLKDPALRNLDNETVIQITPLEGIIILKLISHNEKPERTKDLDDIHDILVNYFEMNSTRFYIDHNEMTKRFTDENFMLEAGAWLAGFDIGLILKRNSSLKELILKILDKEINSISGKISQYYYYKEYFDDIESTKKFLNLIIDGINKS